MGSELSGIFPVKLVTKNIVRGSPGTQFMHMRVKQVEIIKKSIWNSSVFIKITDISLKNSSWKICSFLDINVSLFFLVETVKVLVIFGKCLIFVISRDIIPKKINFQMHSLTWVCYFSQIMKYRNNLC